MNSETKKIFRTKDEVDKLLVQIPELRDDDERLVSNFWHRQLRNAGYDPENLTCKEFLKIYSQNEVLTGADTIVRARAKTQQDNPELRGLKYLDRHRDGNEVTMEINQQ